MPTPASLAAGGGARGAGSGRRDERAASARNTRQARALALAAHALYSEALGAKCGQLSSTTAHSRSKRSSDADAARWSAPAAALP
jgi:hypothetical protein